MTTTSMHHAPSYVHGERTEMPRPLRRLPDLPSSADIRALRAAARKELGMSDRAAGPMSTIWVHPKQVLPQVEQPRRMRIPGGNLLYVEGLAWTPRLMADPLNPRNAAEYLYPLAGADASAPEQQMATSVTPLRGELQITAPSRNQLLDILTEAMARTRQINIPYPPIGEQGIMDAPFGVMAVIKFEDGSPDIAVPQVREGSSRVSHAQLLLDVEPEDTVLRMPSGARPMTEFIADINAIVDKPAAQLTEDEQARVRCATTNFILIVGFEADAPGTINLAEAIKVKVAQEHLNTKLDWSETAQNSVMADDCIDSTYGEGLLSSGEEYAWLRGLTTSENAVAAGLAKDPDDRATRLLWLFTTEEPRVHNAIRRPIAFVLRKENTRKQIHITKNTKAPYATELIAREFRGRAGFEESTVDRITKVLLNGAKIASTSSWTPTSRTLKALEQAALAELRSTSKPGASCTELAVRALYFIAMYDVIRVPRNDKGEQSDRRSVKDVLDAMLQSQRGIAQLAMIVRDGRRGQRPVLRDDAGEPMRGGDGEPVLLRNDTIRYELFPKGSATGDEPAGTDPFIAGKARVKTALQNLAQEVDDLAKVKDDDGNSLIEMQGLPAEAKAWRKELNEVAERLTEWYETGVEYRASQADGTSSRSSLDEDSDSTDTSAA